MLSQNKLISISRTTEVNAVASRMIVEYDNADWSGDVHMTGIFDLLKPANAKLTNAINQIKSESNLEEKDEIRDTKVRSVFYLLHGYLYHPDSTTSNSAETVYRIFEKHGVELVNQSYATESSIIESLLQQLKDADIVTAIGNLPGLSQLIDELTTAQANFETALIAYNAEKAKEGTIESATDLKKVVAAIINNKLVTYLRAMYTLAGETYGEFSRKMFQLIDENNEIVKKRKKKPGGNSGE